MIEQWAAIAGFPGYEVSDLGNVRSWRKMGCRGGRLAEPRLRALVPDKDGYLTVVMRASPMAKPVCLKVHRLVLEAFVGPCPPGMEARHVNDHDVTANALGNLQWGTPRENAQDRERHGRTLKGEQNGMSILTDAKVAEILASTKTNRELREEYGVADETVRGIRVGKSWRHLPRTGSASR